jgi:hypothetical protein
MFSEFVAKSLRGREEQEMSSGYENAHRHEPRQSKREGKKDAS